MEPLQKRDDILPVIIGGDMSTYGIAREFNEAFGVTSLCLALDAIAVIKYSRFCTLWEVPNTKAEAIKAAVEEISAQNPEKHIILFANTDDRIVVAEELQGQLPANVICPIPPHELSERVSNKVEFEKICAEYGLDTTHSEIVNLAADTIAPSALTFPVVAKPAVSSAYAHMYAKGFKKIYFFHEQAELDELWASLKEAGFDGEFLVQELIEGDDTYVDLLTFYISSKGELRMCSGAQILLEDHAPTLLGNPVSMLSRPMPELWEKVGNMLVSLGWRGFANFDLKRDPHTGKAIFMDFNPRIGASSYYTCAAGVNPMYVMARDLVDGADEPCARIEQNAIYTRVPKKLTRRYLADKDLLAEYDTLVSAGKLVNPTRCGHDTLRAQFSGWLMERNFIRKFAKYYPELTDSAF